MTTKTSKFEETLHSWLDKCPSNSVEIIADDDGYWDIRVRLEED
jgi:hypothetical protein